MARVQPQALPRATETNAATVSVKNAAPGLRMITPPSTAGTSQTPYMKARPGKGIASAGPFQSRFQAQNTTPNATAMTAATTMSMVRQRCAVMVLPPSLTRNKPRGTRQDARHTRR